jgi:hypothetical protein
MSNLPYNPEPYKPSDQPDYLGVADLSQFDLTLDDMRATPGVTELSGHDGPCWSGDDVLAALEWKGGRP